MDERSRRSPRDALPHLLGKARIDRIPRESEARELLFDAGPFTCEPQLRARDLLLERLEKVRPVVERLRQLGRTVGHHLLRPSLHELARRAREVIAPPD